MRLSRYGRISAAAAVAALALSGGVTPAYAEPTGAPATLTPGGQLWASTFEGSGQENVVSSVAESMDGQMIVVTGSTGTSEQGSRYSTVAYNAHGGQQVWASEYSGSGAFSAATSVTISAKDTTVFVTGFSENASGDDDYATAAYDLVTGAQLWVRRWAGAGSSNDKAVQVAVGNAVVVTGTSTTAQGSAIVTVAYKASNGARLWVRRVRDASAVGLAVSHNHRQAYVIGNTGFDFDTINYVVNTGKQQWASHYEALARPGRGQSAIGVHSIKVGPRGKTVYVTGTAGSSQSAARHDYATIAYKALTGARVWARRYNGTASRDDEAHSVTVSPGGKTVYVTGSSNGDGSVFSYATVAYKASTGARIWAATFKRPAPSPRRPGLSGPAAAGPRSTSPDRSRRTRAKPWPRRSPTTPPPESSAGGQ